MGMKVKEFISRHRRFLIVLACIVLAVSVMVIIRNNTLESRLKREYGFYDVDVNYYPDEIFVDINLTDEDFERYYGTEEGEEYLDRVISKIILEINDDKQIFNSLIKETKKKKITDCSIYILLRERYLFGSSAARRNIGAYGSDIYPVEDWCTEENKKIQRWTKFLGNGNVWTEKEQMSLPEIRERAKRNE